MDPNMPRTHFILLAAISALALAGCSSEQPPVSASSSQNIQQDGETGEPSTQESEGLAGQARERIEQAWENAGPMLERAGEIAGELGQSVEEIVQRASDDLAAAARYLEEQIDQSAQDLDLQPSNQDAILAPDDDLRADTRAAAHALSAGVGPDYIGVWADEAAACRQIDQQAVTNFAVITPTTMRRYESVCNIESGPLENGETEIAAICLAESMEEERSVAFAMPDIDSLHIRYDGSDTGAELTRCYPQD